MPGEEYGACEKGVSDAEGPARPESGDAQFATLPMEPGEAQPGAVIGSYHLLEPIGKGGMGEVWLAEQKQPVRRRVAIKLIKAGMDTREVVARFESERQALALMEHPNIAKVFDAGATPQGRPYFVMEYVTGIPITQYCDKHRMTLRERLELFMHVCDGVQHAHQKAIIHRDLKPSNILVGEVDGKPVPRDHRFWSGQSHLAALNRRNHVHAGGGDRGDAGIHEPGAGRFDRGGCGHAHGRVLAGRGAV
jgi:serine/threonine protein kinase